MTAKSLIVSSSDARCSSGKTLLESMPSTTILRLFSSPSVSRGPTRPSSLPEFLALSRRLLHSSGCSSSSTTSADAICSCMVLSVEQYVYITSGHTSKLPTQRTTPLLTALSLVAASPPWHSSTSGLSSTPHPGMELLGYTTARCSLRMYEPLDKRSRLHPIGSSTSSLHDSLRRCSLPWGMVFISSSRV